MIEYACTECGTPMASPKSLEGQMDTCPVCGHGVIVPAEMSAAVVSAVSGGTGDTSGFDPMDILDDEPISISSGPRGKLYCLCPVCGDIRPVEESEMGTQIQCSSCGNSWMLPAVASRCSRHVHLEGLQHFNEDGVARQKILRFCRDGESLLLRIEHNGIHDADSIVVETLTPERVGHLPLEVSAELAPHLMQGHPYEAVLVHKSQAGQVIRTVDLEVAYYPS